MKFMQKQKGFTLIELLIVITIIAILAATVFVALDPATRFSQSRNSRRWTEIDSILSAVLQYQVDNSGSFPNNLDSVTTSSQILGTSTTGCDSGCSVAGTTTTSCLDMSTQLVDKYLASIPIDASGGTDAKTLYAINKTANGRIKVMSCNAELSQTISVQR